MTCNLCGRPIERPEDFDRGYCEKHPDLPSAVLYDHQEPEYIYGAPIGDPRDPNHPRDMDGFLIRFRYPAKPERTAIMVTE